MFESPSEEELLLSQDDDAGDGSPEPTDLERDGLEIYIRQVKRHHAVLSWDKQLELAMHIAEARFSIARMLSKLPEVHEYTLGRIDLALGNGTSLSHIIQSLENQDPSLKTGAERQPTELELTDHLANYRGHYTAYLAAVAAGDEVAQHRELLMLSELWLSCEMRYELFEDCVKALLNRDPDCTERGVIADVRFYWRRMERNAMELQKANLLLVVRVVNTLRIVQGRLDMIQEGNLGLLSAAMRFKPWCGTKFTGYAQYWIRQRIMREMPNLRSSITVPGNLAQRMRAVLEARNELEIRFLREPTAEEIASHLKIRLRQVEEALCHLRQEVSLHTPVTEDGDVSLQDTLVSEDGGPEEAAAREEVRQLVMSYLHRLPERNRRIMCMRYGIGTGREMTHDEIAADVGLTRERVRQIDVQMLALLRRLCNPQGLQAYLD